MATKAQLEEEIKELRKFKDKVKKGLINVLNDYCEDARKPVERFCSDVGIPFPERRITLTLETPYGEDIDFIELNSGRHIDDYEIINEKSI